MQQMRRKPTPPVNPDRMQKPIPGWSLTQPPGKWPWESPPQMTDVEETVEYLLDRLEQPEVEERYIKLMFAGISVEEIVHSIAMAGFMEGMYNPDVAEIIKAPIAIYMMGIAEDNQIPVKVFAKSGKPEEKSGGLDDHTLLEIMRRRNPAFYDFAAGYEPEESIVARDLEEKMSRGFLAVEPDEGIAEEVTDFAEDVLKGEIEGGEEPVEEEEV